MGNRFYSRKAPKYTEEEDLVQKQLSTLKAEPEKEENEDLFEKTQDIYTANAHEETAKLTDTDKAAESSAASVLQKGIVITGSVSSVTAMNIFGTVNGDVTCDNEVTINGTVNGNVKASSVQLQEGKIKGDVESSGAVTIANGSSLNGNIGGKSLSCNGRIDGNIKVKENAAIKENATVIGDILAKKISISEGAVCRGNIQTDYDESKVEDEVSTARESISEQSKEKASISLKQYI